MPGIDLLSFHLQNILKLSEQGSKRFSELTSKPSKTSSPVFAARLVSQLDL
jgi:hypothetical protein